MRGTGRMGDTLEGLSNVSNVGQDEIDYSEYFIPEPAQEQPMETGAFDSGIFTPSDVGLAPPIVNNPAAQGIDVNKLISYAGSFFQYQAERLPNGQLRYVPRKVAKPGALPGWAIPAGIVLLIAGIAYAANR